MTISNLEQLYTFAAQYIVELRDQGRDALAAAVDRALSGGTTSGEILDGLGGAMVQAIRDDSKDQSARDALAYIESVVGPIRRG
jgi:hypothetical protein